MKKGARERLRKTRRAFNRQRSAQNNANYRAAFAAPAPARVERMTPVAEECHFTPHPIHDFLQFVLQIEKKNPI